jgi:hypothetical protein
MRSTTSVTWESVFEKAAAHLYPFKGETILGQRPRAITGSPVNITPLETSYDLEALQEKT